MIDAVARKIALNIKSMVPDHPASVDVMRFALAAILNGVFIISLSLIISIPLGTTAATALILVSFAILRQISGGIHLKSSVACVIVSTSGVVILSLISRMELNSSVTIVMNGLNVLLALSFAPSRIEKQTRIPKKYFPLLKLSTTIVVAANLIIQSPVLAATFFVQCLTLIHFEKKGGK